MFNTHVYVHTHIHMHKYVVGILVRSIIHRMYVHARKFIVCKYMCVHITVMM